MVKLGSMKTYFIKTFGCQMNVADSQKIAARYADRDWKLAESIEKADEVVINTCSVRASAEHRVYSLVRKLAAKKITITGCMLRYPLRTLKQKLPSVAEFKRIEVFIHNSPFIFHNSNLHTLVPISNGCNNFCSYCVVPYARGREKSRPFDEIICEVKELVKRGIAEITLLGQNVNSYGKDFKPFKRLNTETFSTPFARLLFELNKIPGLHKISFLTSNPWDLNDQIIEAMKLPKIDRYLHLPLQSGDGQILKKMNRKHTSKQYLALVRKIKRQIPDISFGTDIIVGFPGETDEQFQNTVKLCRQVGFVKAYINRYSPRPGTAAFKLGDSVPASAKKRRWQILEQLINQS